MVSSKSFLVLTASILLEVNRCQCANIAQIILIGPQKLVDQFQSADGNCEDIENNMFLNLQNSGLRYIDADFVNASDVNCLSLEDNEISFLSPAAFQLMPDLTYVNLARNKFSLANFSDLASHSQLRTLYLDECNCKLTENSTFSLINKFPRLAFLYLRNNSLEDVTSLAFAPKLTHLYLSSNHLGNSNLSFLEDAPKNLQLLDLSDNGIRSLNASKLSSLRVLRLDDNQIDRLCGKTCSHNSVLLLKGATKLKILSVARNGLTNIEPDTFDDAKHLVDLDLSHNEIGIIRKDTFEYLELLRNLSLRDNAMSEMPDLYGLESMEFLWLADNRLEVVTSESFSANINLRFVDLSNNRIKVVQESAFFYQTRLEHLDLSNNRLTSFPNRWLSNLINLKSLFVNGNELKNLDNVKLDYAENYAKLKHVYLQNNSITTISTSSLSNVFKKLHSVTLEIFDDKYSNNIEALPNNEACKCNCDDKSNEVDIF